MRSHASVRRTARAVALRPALWIEGLRAAAAMSRRRWWRRPPFLPGPDPRYLDWRMTTAYGSAEADPHEEDVVAYLRWRARVRRR